MSLLATLFLPTIWVVDASNGPGTHFLDLQPAVLAAQRGDTILVRAGVYRQCTIVDKALTIRGAGPAVTSVAGLVVQGVPAGDFLVLAGLRCEAAAPMATQGMWLVGPGTVLVNDCQALGASDEQGLDGVLVSGGMLVYATRSSFLGGDGTYVGAYTCHGGRGAQVNSNARLIASGCAFLGGRAGDNPLGTTLGGDGVMVSGGAAELFDSTCIGGDAGIALPFTVGFGGDAVYVEGADVRVAGGLAPVLQGGVAWEPLGVSTQNPGVAVWRTSGTATVHSGVLMLPAYAGAPLTSGTIVGQPERPRLAVQASYLPSGETDLMQPLTATYDGLAPYAPCFLIVGFRPAFSSAVVPDLLIDLDAAGCSFGVLDANGQFTLSFVPAFVLGLTGIPFLAQAGTFDPVLGARTSNCDVRIYGP